MLRFHLSMGEPADGSLPPSLPWRFSSVMVMGFIGTLTRLFMHGPNSQKAHGLNDFLNLIDDREDARRRTRGLLTGSTTQPFRSLDWVEAHYAVSLKSH